MREEIIFAGFGGQGIMLMGKLLAYASMFNGRFVTWMPSYGAEVRGGTAHSMVIISDKSIPSPVVSNPSCCIVMNRPSFDKFEERVKKGGLLIINTSLIKRPVKRKDIEVVEIPATDIANRLGNTRVANMVMLGCLVARKKLILLNELSDSLKEVIPGHRHQLIPLNERALKEGFNYGSR